MKILTLLASMLASLIGRTRREAVANSAHVQPHENGRIGYTAEGNFNNTLFLLGKKGAAENSVTPCGATDEPLGVVADRPTAGERATVYHLGATKGTLSMIASGAIASQTRVYTDAGGKVTATASTGRYLVGRTVDSASADGDPVEVVPCFPVVQA